METLNYNAVKRIYLNPQIVCIELDNEISLALESSPPSGPGEAHLSTEHLIDSPFKHDMA
ncbi:MAG: hypothetical protein AUK44_08480 [Porphyromonadaceae bacterium CG2_30_38_12]|nr:MAG: hypothetical protein AUK44_08480 [Porphyromonadaceae bacterium CG2_30_38_12]